MTALAFALCVLCQICLVTGQVLLKRGMDATHDEPFPWRTVVAQVGGGIAILSVWFFLWLGLLQDWELTQLFPFEGLSPPLIVLSAWFFLKERVTPRAWIGILLIGAGVMLVSGS